MPEFDGTRAFGTVMGTSLARYEQDGHYYDGAYHPLTMIEGAFVRIEQQQTAVIEDEVPEKPQWTPETVDPTTAPNFAFDTPTAKITAMLDAYNAPTIHDLHWTRVKKLAESLGVPYESKPQAIKAIDALA